MIMWVQRAVELQLFLSLVSLPVLVAWGLPFSLMTIASNLLFGPVLSLFLLLSTLVFFCELVSLPNQILIQLLEYLTTAWRSILSWHHHTWLIGFAKPHLAFLCAVVCIAFYIIARRSWHGMRRIGAYLILFMCMYVVCGWYGGRVPAVSHIPVNGGSVIVIRHADTTTIIDPGYIAQRPSAQSWLQYTLLTWLIQMTGSLTIDHLILLQPGSRIFEAMTTLCPKAHIKHMYVPWWQGTMSRGALRHFCQMKELLERQGVKLVRCGGSKIKIVLSSAAQVCLVPLGAISQPEYSYCDVGVECSIDKEVVAFYAAKHVNNVQE